MIFNTVKELENKMELCQTAYTGVRVVDPVAKEVVYVIRGGEAEASYQCYQFWDNDKVCPNCISMRAKEEKHVITKIGGNNSGIFVVTSLPVQIGERKLSLEMIQDVTANLYFENGEACEYPQKIMRSVSEHIDRLISTDELTGLYNRRFINENLPFVLYNARQNRRPLSLMYVDVDSFKKINDTYGHDAGDQVLKGMAKLFQQKTHRNECWAARYGGDEFILCLPGVNHEAAIKIAERIRNAVSQKAFFLSGNTVHITCSAGIHTVSPDEKEISYQEILTLADKNLYKAKSKGKNRVV